MIIIICFFILFYFNINNTIEPATYCLIGTNVYGIAGNSKKEISDYSSNTNTDTENDTNTEANTSTGADDNDSITCTFGSTNAECKILIYLLLILI